MTKLAYVFPGQGSQSVGMLSDIESSVAETFAEASVVVGYDLWKLISQDPDNRLNQTEYTQPAMLASSIALYRLAQKQGIPVPHVVAGHSLGEYSALVAADVLQFSDAVALVQQRGRFMQAAVPLGQGGMAAVIGLSDDKVREACEAAGRGEVVQAANYNAPGQVVISGSISAVGRSIKACKAAGAKRSVALSASAPFHSALMEPAAKKMAVVLESVNFSFPKVKVVQNIDAAIHDEPKIIKENLIAQICGAVRWTDTIRTFGEMGVKTLVECGPGKVLTGLVKRTDRSMVTCPIESFESISETRKALGL